MKRLAVIVLAIAVLVAFTACGQGTPAATESAPTTSSATEPSVSSAAEPSASTDTAATTEKKTIGFCVADANDQWLSYLYDEAQKFAEENPDFEFVFGDGNKDLNAQISIVETWINSGVDAIVVNPYDSEATGPIIDMCHKAGVYAISVNRPFANQEAADAGCYGDSKQSGVLEMQYLADKLNGKGKVAIFIGEPAQEAAIKRTEGFKEVLEKYPDMEVVFEQTGHWNRDEGRTLMENLLQAGTEVNCIASNNDEMAIGAYLALQDAGNKDIIVGGIDASPDALQYLTEDSQYVVTVFQDAHGQAYGSLGAAVSLLKGETVEKEILIPYELVTPDLRDEYLAKQGAS